LQTKLTLWFWLNKFTWKLMVQWSVIYDEENLRQVFTNVRIEIAILLNKKLSYFRINQILNKQNFFSLLWTGKIASILFDFLLLNVSKIPQTLYSVMSHRCLYNEPYMSVKCRTWKLDTTRPVGIDIVDHILKKVASLD